MDSYSARSPFRAPPASRPSPTEAGISLIEVSLAFGLSATILVSLFSLFEGSHHLVEDCEAETTALLLAGSILEEIRGKAFEEPGTEGTFGREGGEGSSRRTAYDDVDDYDGYGPHSPPRDVEGLPLEDFSRFTLEIEVVNVSSTDFETPRADGSTPFKRIVVEVSSDVAGEATVRLEMLAGRQ